MKKHRPKPALRRKPTSPSSRATQAVKKFPELTAKAWETIAERGIGALLDAAGVTEPAERRLIGGHMAAIAAKELIELGVPDCIAIPGPAGCLIPKRIDHELRSWLTA